MVHYHVHLPLPVPVRSPKGFKDKCYLMVDDYFETRAAANSYARGHGLPDTKAIVRECTAIHRGVGGQGD